MLWGGVRLGVALALDRHIFRVDVAPHLIHGLWLLDSRVTLGEVPREQKMLKGLLPRVIYHQVY